MDDNQTQKGTEDKQTIAESVPMFTEELMNSEPVMGNFQRLYQIFFNPGKTFDSIKKSPNIILPLIISGVVMGIFAFLTQGVMLEFLKTTMQNAPGMEEAAIDPAMMETILNFSKITTIISLIATGFLAPFVGGLISHLIAMIAAGEGTWKQSVSVAANAYMIQILGVLVGLPLVLMTSNYVFSFSPAVFMTADMTDPLYMLMSNISLFGVWGWIVQIIGFKKIHQFGMIKAAIAVLLPTVVMIAVGVVPLMMK